MQLQNGQAVCSVLLEQLIIKKTKGCSMEENVRKELKDLTQMVSNWQQSYLRDVSQEGNNEYLVSDFAEEIENYILSYVGRLQACKYITPDEAGLFCKKCYGYLDELRSFIELQEKLGLNKREKQREGEYEKENLKSNGKL